MPELPDITCYVNALRRFVVGETIQKIVVRSPFVLRTFEPDLHECEEKTVLQISRLGKRVILELSADLFIVFHLMIGGRFHWKKPHTKPSRKTDLAALSFTTGTLMLTEASKMKRASIHVHRGRKQLEEHNRGGLNVFQCSLVEFCERLKSENRTLKKALTDPAKFDGIGNAYSDEILHAAELSPIKLTTRVSEAESSRLFAATQSTLKYWTETLSREMGDDFPEKVTAFHDGMSIHGRFGQPCPVCRSKIQRIVSNEREFNYCPRCQTGGNILKDRSLSRLLRDDWPNTIDD